MKLAVTRAQTTGKYSVSSTLALTRGKMVLRPKRERYASVILSGSGEKGLICRIHEISGIVG